MNSDSKITIYLTISDETKRQELEIKLMTDYLDIAVLSFADLHELNQRLKASPPQLIIASADFISGTTLLKDAMNDQERFQTSYIILGDCLEKDDFMDEIMIGKMQFFPGDLSEDEWKLAIKKSFKFSLDSNLPAFLMKKIKMGEILMNVGDPAEKIYILKKGRLQAFLLEKNGHKKILGEVVPGEFVGEMAYFNQEPRSASVIALEDSELVEIPLSSFDRVIYQKPAWAMKLIETFSKRLKKFIEKSNL